MEKIYTIDRDPEAGYEELSFWRRLIDLVYLPLLNSLPGNFRNVIKKTNKSAKKVIETATTHTALETLYNHGYISKSRGLLTKLMTKIWFNLHNSKAVRNRLRLVEKEIARVIKEVDERDNDIRVLGIASGSSRALLKAIKKTDPDQNKLSVLFLDKNPKALEYSRELKKEIIPEREGFRWVEDPAGNFTNYIKGKNSLDLVEMVGLLDYFGREKALRVLKDIFEHLSPKGTLITANVTDNKERPFITKVIDWKMVYRTPEELVKLVIEAGFDPKKVRAVYEPLQIHIVIIAQK